MIRVIGFGIMLVFLAPPVVLGQKAKKNAAPAAANNVTEGTPAEYDQLKKVSEVVGKLAYVDQGSDAKSFTLDIQYFYPVPSNYNGNLYQRIPGGGFRPINGTAANYQNQINNLLAKQQSYINKNPVKYQAKIQQLAGQIQNLQVRLMTHQMQQMMTMNRLFNNLPGGANGKLATGFKEFNMETIDNFVVRRLNPPFEYDDKGNVKKYTKEELDKMKGKDKNLVGYEAKTEDLQAGQIVRVYLVKPKAKPKDDPKADKNEDKDKEKKADDMPPDPPQVRLILILADPEASAPDPPPKKKKNKQ
jgi:hypothetical protein